MKDLIIGGGGTLALCILVALPFIGLLLSEHIIEMRHIGVAIGVFVMGKLMTA